jgi:hypothetical protein
VIPLFSSDCTLVGWMVPDEHIFDTSMRWIAFISYDHAWSAVTGDWLGPIDGLTCLDTAGKPVAWNPDQGPTGQMTPMKPMRAMKAMKPMTPMKPMRPMKPMKRATPMGGWSRLSFLEWQNQ